MSESEISNLIISLEKESLDVFATGNVTGYTMHAAESMTYFDNLAATKLVKGRENVVKYLSTAFGELEVHTYTMIEPNVQIVENMAVLEFEYESFSPDGVKLSRWITSVVYENREGAWKSIHAHWTMLDDFSE